MLDVPPPDTRTRVALAPDLRRMPDRAARAWAERMAVRHRGGPEYAVSSESGATYLVDVEAGTCTCPDATIRAATCKHQRRVAIEITARRVPPPGHRRATCVACGTETFVPADAAGPALCGTCSFEEGDVLVDRETGDRVVVERVTDRPADEVTIAAAGTTVADYPTNDAYPADDVVVIAHYLTDGSAADRAYAFPHSRLQQIDDAAVVP